MSFNSYAFYNYEIIIIIMRLLLLLLLLLSLISCSKGSFENKLELKIIDEVCIDYDSISRGDYRYNSSLLKDGKIYFYGLQRSNYLIDVYNVSTNTEKHIKLPKDGPNKLNEIVSIDAISLDSILIYDFGKVIIFNQEGSIIFKHSFDDIPDSIPKGRVISTNEAPIKIYKDKIYFLYSPNELNFRSKKWFEFPIAMTYDIREKKYDIIPINYSDFVKSNEGQFGYYLWANFNLVNDKILYNFPFQPDVFEYDISNRKGAQRNDKNSRFSDDYSESVSYKSEYFIKEAALLGNTYFHKIIFDNINNFYYRFNHGKVEYKVNDLKFNSSLDKPLALTVFDENFKVLGEFQLKGNTYDPIQIFTANGFLYISKSHLNNENSIEGKHCFEKISISKIK